MIKKIVVKLVVVALALIVGSSSARAYSIIELTLIATILHTTNSPYSLLAVTEPLQLTLTQGPISADDNTINKCSICIEQPGEVFEDQITSPYNEISEITTVGSNNIPSNIISIDPELQGLAMLNSLLPGDDNEFGHVAAAAEIIGLIFEVPTHGNYNLSITGNIYNIIHGYNPMAGDTRTITLSTICYLEIYSLGGFEQTINLFEYTNTFDDFQVIIQYPDIPIDVNISLKGLDPDTYRVNLAFTNEVTRTPVPGAVWLLGSGLLGLGLLGWRRKRGADSLTRQF